MEHLNPSFRDTTTREQFILGQAVAGAIQAANPPFCGRAPEVEVDEKYINNVANCIAFYINYSYMATEDLQDILNEVLEICAEKKDFKQEKD